MSILSDTVALLWTGTPRPASRHPSIVILAVVLGATACGSTATETTSASIGSLPMAVITASHRELPAGLATSEVDRLNAAWNQGQQDWMTLSTAAHLVAVEDTSHHIEIDQPGVVIDEITRLLP